jgi:hypothetical protein
LPVAPVTKIIMSPLIRVNARAQTVAAADVGGEEVIRGLL